MHCCRYSFWRSRCTVGGNWWRGMREVGEVRVVRLTLRNMLAGLAAGAAGSVLLGLLMEQIGAALPRLDATLMSYSLVASWWQNAEAHGQLVALDCGGPGLYRRIPLQRSSADRGALCVACCPGGAGTARLAPRGRRLRLRPEPRYAAARRQCSGATHPRRCAGNEERTADWSRPREA